MPRPPITLTCDCGTRGHVAYGERWTCPECGRSYDTSAIPAEEYDALQAGLRRYKWLTIGPPLALAAILIPATVLLDDLRYAFLLFILVVAYGLLVLPHLRGRASDKVRSLTARWHLEAD